MANWIIILVTVGVFAVQVSQMVQYESSGPLGGEEEAIPGITGSLRLDGWGLKGLLGYMWLHGGVFHLLGNMWFLWLFGNAVCAKVGSARYLLFYVLFGVAGGVAHLLMSDGSAIGASGAMNGVVGMYLVLFFENNITCYVGFWFIWAYVHQFAVSSCWMILFWLFWDMVGAFSGGSGVAHFAHLGGFAAGFGVAILLCHYGWVTMERYERSLLQMWQERKAKQQKAGPDLSGDHLRISVAAQEAVVEAAIQLAAPAVGSSAKAAESVPYLSLENGRPVRKRPAETSVRLTCTCNQRIKVPQRYAGKVVRCPRCERRIAVPDIRGRTSADVKRPAVHASARPNDGGSHIRFACTCGKRIRVPVHYAGRSGKCPRCGCRLRIPEAS